MAPEQAAPVAQPLLSQPFPLHTAWVTFLEVHVLPGDDPAVVVVVVVVEAVVAAVVAAVVYPGAPGQF